MMQVLRTYKCLSKEVFWKINHNHRNVVYCDVTDSDSTSGCSSDLDIDDGHLDDARRTKKVLDTLKHSLVDAVNSKIGKGSKYGWDHLK